MFRSLMLAAVMAGAVALPQARAADPGTAVQTIDVMNKVWGRHSLMRANHAKGVVVEGTFTPNEAGRALSTAAIFAGAAVPVTVRFSDSTGLPEIPDGAPFANPHGMAIRFHLPDRGVDVVTNSLAFFPVKNGEEFLQLFQAVAASGPDAPKPTPLEQFFAAHPQAPKAFGSAATPSSFAREQYNGVDAFVFVDAAGKRQPFRFAFVPEAGVDHLAPDAAAKQPANFLVDELPARLKQGPVMFHVRAQLAEPGDSTADPSQPWPAERRMVDLGTITLTHAADDNAKAQQALRMLPNNLCPGIEVSDDPLIDARVRAYLISFGRRVQ